MLTDGLALTDDHIYVPVENATSPRIRLFVPQYTEYTIPHAEKLDSVLVFPADDHGRGVAFEPTGGPLVEELQSATDNGLTADLETLAGQLAEGLVEVFELADSAKSDVDIDNGRISIQVTNRVYGPADRFDHPVASIITAAVAAEQNTPAKFEMAEPENETYVITYSLDYRLVSTLRSILAISSTMYNHKYDLIPLIKPRAYPMYWRGNKSRTRREWKP